MLQRKKKLKQNYSRYSNPKNQKQKNGKYIFIYVFFLVLISIILVAHIGQSVKVTHLNYKIDKLEDKYQEVKTENHHLQLKLARDSSLANIEDMARTKLNMKEPETMQVVVLDNEDNKQKTINKNGENIFFVFRMFNNLRERLGTVEAGSPD